MGGVSLILLSILTYAALGWGTSSLCRAGIDYTGETVENERLAILLAGVLWPLFWLTCIYVAITGA